jgi:hypothetical protein
MLRVSFASRRCCDAAHVFVEGYQCCVLQAKLFVGSKSDVEHAVTLAQCHKERCPCPQQTPL